MPQIITKLSERLKKQRADQTQKSVTHTMDQILWEFGALLVEEAAPSSSKTVSREQIAIHALRAFEAGGFAIRETDADGNLTWRATPDMQAYSPDAAGGTVTIRAPSFDREELLTLKSS